MKDKIFAVIAIIGVVLMVIGCVILFTADAPQPGQFLCFFGIGFVLLMFAGEVSGTFPEWRADARKEKEEHRNPLAPSDRQKIIGTIISIIVAGVILYFWHTTAGIIVSIIALIFGVVGSCSPSSVNGSDSVNKTGGWGGY